MLKGNKHLCNALEKYKYKTGENVNDNSEFERVFYWEDRNIEENLSWNQFGIEILNNLTKKPKRKNYK